jgi:hypothetical protein
MKRTWLAILAGLAVLGLAAGAQAADGLWAGEEKKADDAAGDAAGGATGDLKTDLGSVLYKRAIEPIEAKLEMAAKQMELYDKENGKDAEKRNFVLMMKLKQQASEAYLGAALAAKKAVGMVSKPEQKKAIEDQYEKPNQQKAIDIKLELAATAHEKGDLRTAVGLYKSVLTLDKDNAAAKDALTRIMQEAKEAQAKAGSGSKGGGSDDDTKSWEREKDSNTGRGYNNNSYGNTGRGY